MNYSAEMKLGMADPYWYEWPVGELKGKVCMEKILTLYISEKIGRGVPGITQSYGKEAYEFRENSIIVKIPFNWINVMGDKMGDKPGDKNWKSPLTQTQTLILREIRNNPSITKPKLAVRIGKTAIDNGIAVQKKYEFTERVGSNKSGYWKVLKMENVNGEAF